MSNPLTNLIFHSPTLYEIDNSDFINMLERTIINNNEQNRLAQQAATELSNTITAMNVHHSMAGVKNKLYNDLNTLVDNTLQNYGGNFKYATNEIFERSRKVINEMQPFVKSNEDYEKWVASVKANPDIDADTKEFILNDPKNKYHFDAKVINENGEEEYIDNWQVGNNDNIIGYKPWQAGREPVKNINYADIALGVFKQIEPNSNDWEYRTYYDTNGNKLQGVNILNAAYWIDANGKETKVTPDMINKAIETYIAANPEVVASLRQDYEKALYFRKKGEDKYNVAQGENANLDFEAFKNRIFGGFGEAFAYKKTESGYKPGIVTSSSDSNKSSNGVVDYNKFNNTTGTVGTITKNIDMTSMNSNKVNENINIYTNTDEIFRKNNITEVGSTAKEKLDILLKNKDNLNLTTDEFATMKDNLYKAMDNERDIELYKEDVLSRTTPEQREVLSQFDRLNNGNYINDNKDEDFAKLYNNFFNENGEPLSSRTISAFNKEFGNNIIKSAKKNNINLSNEGIFYDSNKNTFTINHTPTAFKTFATLFNDTAAEKYGAFKKFPLLKDMEIENEYSLLGGNVRRDIRHDLFEFGREYNKVRDNRDNISVQIGTREYNKPIEIEQLHDYSIAKLEAEGVDNTIINREKDDFRASLKLIDFTQYQIYAPQELIDALNNKTTDSHIKSSLVDMGSDDNTKALLQNWIAGAMNAKEGDKNYDLTKSNSENLITTFVDIPNIGVGNTIEFTHNGKEYTIFLKTFNDDGTGGLNDAQREYYRSTMARREVDKLELGTDENGKNPYTKTLDLGSNVYKMGYTDGTYHFNGKAIEKNDLIKLVNYRNSLKAEAKELAKRYSNYEDYMSYVNALLRTDENGDLNNVYLNQYSDIINLLVNYTGQAENVVKQNMLNGLINYY